MCSETEEHSGLSTGRSLIPPDPHLIPTAQYWAWPTGHSEHKRPVYSPPCLSASHSHGTKCEPVPLHRSAGASVDCLSVPWRKASRQMVPTALLPPPATGYVLTSRQLCAHCSLQTLNRDAQLLQQRKKGRSRKLQIFPVSSLIWNHICHMHTARKTQEYGDRDKGSSQSF